MSTTFLSTNARAVRNSLLEKAERYSRDGWRAVRLDDARHHALTPRRFAGYLATLSAFGLYRPLSSGWGEVYDDVSERPACRA